jgi:aryl-alcohol dehydrogenase-like predicted oxidoreductase
MKRRTFLKAVGGTAVTSQTVISAADGKDTTTDIAGIPQRALGKSGKKVSIVCFPGLALRNYEQEEGAEGLHQAFDNGITHFDVAPAYGKDGLCEVRMGIGMKGIPRDKYFLSCKTKMRDAAGAKEELDRSLKRLNTDHFDLYQLHCLKHPDEVKEAFGPGGAMETIFKAREEGKIGLIGFSAHTTKGALAAMKEYKFDTVMFPINFVELFTIGYGKAVLDLAAEQDVPVLAIKAMSRGRWKEGVERTRKWWYRSVETKNEVSMAIRYALSQSTVKTIVPPSFLDLVDKAVVAARDYSPITAPEEEELRQIAAESESVFRREEEQVAGKHPRHRLLYPDSPHDHCPGWHV